MEEYELTGQDWARWEVEAVVADYLEMLTLELAGEPFNKAEHNRDIRRIVVARSRGSVEFKHRNISAVLIDMDMPYVEGYKPLFNYQDLLYDVVADHVMQAPGLLSLVKREVDSPPMVPTVEDILASLVDAPPAPERRTVGKVRERRPHRARQPNYILREVENSALGSAGEDFVIRYEQARLIQAGRGGLAERVEQVSVTRGPGEGFDVLSYENNGTDRLIEVKTTKFGEYTPFFVTSNEYARSKADSDRYHVYRVFGFREKPRLFTVAGAFDGFFSLDPALYTAKIKSDRT